MRPDPGARGHPFSRHRLIERVRKLPRSPRARSAAGGRSPNEPQAGLAIRDARSE